MKRNITAVLAAVVAFALTMPMSAMAAEERREQAGTDGQSFSVQAVATVTAEDLAAMNLNAMVSFPVTIPLTRADSTYSGEGDVYMFGILGDGKKLTVSINESDTANHGIIKYRKAAGGDPQYITIDSKYFESCEGKEADEPSTREEGEAADEPLEGEAGEGLVESEAEMRAEDTAEEEDEDEQDSAISLYGAEMSFVDANGNVFAYELDGDNNATITGITASGQVLAIPEAIDE